MKVFQIENNVNRFRFFVGVRDEDSTALANIDCTPRASQWIPPQVHIFDEQLEEGDFYQFMSNMLIMSPQATHALSPYLSTAGELLPLPYRDTTYTLFNVTNCINCIPPQHMEDALFSNTFVFDRECLTRSPSTVFKVPRFAKSRIFIVEGMQDWDRELRTVVERAQLQGLEFKMVWTDEAGG